jgi:hypothetical protein
MLNDELKSLKKEKLIPKYLKMYGTSPTNSLNISFAIIANKEGATAKGAKIRVIITLLQCISRLNSTAKNSPNTTSTGVTMDAYKVVRPTEYQN